jgi:spore maturation protein CgeB
MKILVYESAQTYSIKFPVSECLKDLGHKVENIFWEDMLFKMNNYPRVSSGMNKLFFSMYSKIINSEIINKIDKSDFDIFLVFRGDHIYPETISYAKNKIANVVLWSTDHIYNKNNSNNNTINSAKLYNCILSPRKHLFEEYKKQGISTLEYVEWYYRPGMILDKIDNYKYEYNNNVSFIGSWSKRREEFINSLDTFKSHVCGWGWGKNITSNFSNTIFNNQVDMKTMNLIFQKSKININLLTIENFDQTNFRNFEIPAMRSFQISERTEMIQSLFEEDKEIVLFSSIDELKSKTDFYLKNDTIREKIAHKGFERLLKSDYSIDNRVKQFLKLFS